MSEWEKRIADALWLLFRDRPLPLSLFGDFHQLCVANPLGTDTSRRYERGIHYTPAPIVDYLVNAILDRAFAGHSIDEIKRLRILDPSCGCGAFLIAALRYVVRCLNDHAGKADDSAGSWFQERFDVLNEMFFGIDIDERAVAWTIRLLLLAVWEASVVDLQKVPRQCCIKAAKEHPQDVEASNCLLAQHLGVIHYRFRLSKPIRALREAPKRYPNG